MVSFLEFLVLGLFLLFAFAVIDGLRVQSEWQKGVVDVEVNTFCDGVPFDGIPVGYRILQQHTSQIPQLNWNRVMMGYDSENHREIYCSQTAKQIFRGRTA